MSPKETTASAIHIIRSVIFALQQPTPLTQLATMLLRHQPLITSDLKWMAELKQANKVNASLTVIPHVGALLEQAGEPEAQALIRQLPAADTAATLRLCLSLPGTDPATQLDYLTQLLDDLSDPRPAESSPPAISSPATTATASSGPKSTPSRADETSTEPVKPLQAAFGQVQPSKQPAPAARTPTARDAEASEVPPTTPPPSAPAQTTPPARDMRPAPAAPKSGKQATPATTVPKSGQTNTSPERSPQPTPSPALASPAPESRPEPVTQTDVARWSQKWDSGTWETGPNRTREDTWDLLEYIKYLANSRQINTVAKEIQENHNTFNRIWRDNNRAPKVLDRLHGKLKRHMRDWRQSRQSALLTAPQSKATTRAPEKTTHTPLPPLPEAGPTAEQVAKNVRALYRNQEGQTLLKNMLVDTRHLLSSNEIKQTLRAGGLTIKEAEEVCRLNSESTSLNLSPTTVQAALRVLMSPLPESYGDYAHTYALPTAGRRVHERVASMRQDYMQLMTRTPMSREALEYAAQTEQIELPSTLLSRLFNEQRVSLDELRILRTLRERLHNDLVQELREWSFERSADTDYPNPVNRAWFALAQEAVKSVHSKIPAIKAELNENDSIALDILTGQRPAPKGSLGVTPRIARRIMVLANEQQLSTSNIWSR